MKHAHNVWLALKKEKNNIDKQDDKQDENELDKQDDNELDKLDDKNNDKQPGAHKDKLCWCSQTLWGNQLL